MNSSLRSLALLTALLTLGACADSETADEYTDRVDESETAVLAGDPGDLAASDAEEADAAPEADTGSFPIAPSGSDIELVPGQRYYNDSESHYLVFQEDGNLVVYTSEDEPTWSLYLLDNPPDWRSNVRAKMQADGNLVTYSSADDTESTWDTDTYGHPGAELDLDDDGTLRISTPNGDLWTSD